MLENKLNFILNDIFSFYYLAISFFARLRLLRASSIDGSNSSAFSQRSIALFLLPREYADSASLLHIKAFSLFSFDISSFACTEYFMASAFFGPQERALSKNLSASK